MLWWVKSNNNSLAGIYSFSCGGNIGAGLLHPDIKPGMEVLLGHIEQFWWMQLSYKQQTELMAEVAEYSMEKMCAPHCRFLCLEAPSRRVMCDQQPISQILNKLALKSK